MASERSAAEASTSYLPESSEDEGSITGAPEPTSASSAGPAAKRTKKPKVRSHRAPSAPSTVLALRQERWKGSIPWEMSADAATAFAQTHGTSLGLRRHSCLPCNWQTLQSSSHTCQTTSYLEAALDCSDGPSDG